MPDVRRVSTGQAAEEGVSKRKPLIEGDWIVKLKCTVVKQLFVNGTKEQAEEDPYACDVQDEMELEQVDWELLDIEANKF